MTSKKTDWNELPNEILDKIVQHIDCIDTSKTQWMFVKKQWLQKYHSIIYENIDIDLVKYSQDKTLDKIFNSVFAPGKYVKTVIFSSLKAPTVDMEKYDVSTDTLLKVMSSCRNVERVKFGSSAMKAEDWSYFTIVFSSCPFWKSLQYLPSPTDSNMAHCYYCCASQLKNTLKKFELHRGMIGIDQLHILQEYKNMQVLTIGPGFLKNIEDCFDLLQHIHHLQHISIDFLNPPIYNILLYRNHISDNNNKEFLDIADRKINCPEEISVKNYIPPEQDLISIRKMFTKLSSLNISSTHRKSQWSQALFQSDAMEKFVGFILEEVPKFDISVGLVDEVKGLDSILQAMRNSSGKNSDVDVNISFDTPKDDVSDITITVSRQGFKELPNVEIHYAYSATDLHTSKSTNLIKHIFESDENGINIKTLKLHFETRRCIDPCFKALLDTASRKYCNINKLILSGGVLMDPSQNIVLMPGSQLFPRLSSVTFQSDICAAAFRSISQVISSIKMLRLIDIYLLDERGQPLGNNFDISMPSTAVDEMYIQGSGVGKSNWIAYFAEGLEQVIALLSVKSHDQNISKYYIAFHNNEKTSFQEFGEEPFNILMNTRNTQKTVLINLQFKSIRTVFFKLPVPNSTERIKITII